MPERRRIFSRCNTNASTWTVKLGSTYRLSKKDDLILLPLQEKQRPISISKPLQETELRKLPLESLQATESVFCCVGWAWKLPEMDIYMQLQRQVLRQPWECTSRSGSSEEHFLVDSPSLRLLHFEMTLTSALRGHETTLVTTPLFFP
jgi:hypothetical protein